MFLETKDELAQYDDEEVKDLINSWLELNGTSDDELGGAPSPVSPFSNDFDDSCNGDGHRDAYKTMGKECYVDDLGPVDSAADIEVFEYSSASPRKPSMMGPASDEEENTSQMFSFTRNIHIRPTLDYFVKSIEDERTVVHPEWPSQKPTDGLFFANVDIGGVDFGGPKSGTPYEVPEVNGGLLVNYSGDNPPKLSRLYPDENYLRIVRLRLFFKDLPQDSCPEDWTCRAIRGNASVYLYNKMALYVFGGDIYGLDYEDRLYKKTHNISANNASFIFLGPSVKPRQSKPKRKASEESDKIKRNNRRKTGVFDP